MLKLNSSFSENVEFTSIAVYSSVQIPFGAGQIRMFGIIFVLDCEENPSCNGSSTSYESTIASVLKISIE